MGILSHCLGNVMLPEKMQITSFHRKKSISHYSRERIFKCLNNIDLFLGWCCKGMFPTHFQQVKKFALMHCLTFGVNIQKMERQDAPSVLQELASRNLLNLINNQVYMSSLTFIKFSISIFLSIKLNCLLNFLY